MKGRMELERESEKEREATKRENRGEEDTDKPLFSKKKEKIKRRVKENHRRKPIPFLPLFSDNDYFLPLSKLFIEQIALKGQSRT